jgi:hypothetical protein
MLAELPGHPGSSPDAPRFEPSAFSGVLLAAGTVRSGAGGDGSAGWRMYYHQATPLPPGVDQMGKPVRS